MDWTRRRGRGQGWEDCFIYHKPRFSLDRLGTNGFILDSRAV
jgi:hypothetical protein